MRPLTISAVLLVAATNLFGQSPEALVVRAQQEMQTGQYTEAERDLSHAAQAEPAKWNLWYDLGLLRVNLGQNGPAIQAFDQARKIDPKQPPPYFGLGLAYLKGGEVEKAAGAYKAGLALDSTDVAANQNYAFLLLQKHDFLDAVQPLQRLEELQPQDVAAHAALIDASLKAGLQKDAEREIDQLLSTHIATLDQELSVAKMLLVDREPDDAAKVLQEAAATWPGRAEPHGELGLLLLQKQQYEAAARELGQAAQIQPESAHYALGLGEVLLRWRHDPVALQYLLKIQPRYADLPLYKFELGLAHFNLTEYALALKPLEDLAQKQTQSPQVLFLIGASYQGLGALDKAEENYRKAVGLKPDEATYNLALASLLRKVRPDDLAEPVRLSERVLLQNPENKEAKLLLASCYQAQGKLTEAQSLLESVIADDPESRNAHVALAQVYFREKKVEEAQKQDAIAAKLESRKQEEISPWGPGVGKP